MTQRSIQPKLDTDVLVALGANLPTGERSPRAAIGAAIDALDSSTCRVRRKSRLFNTPCFPLNAGPAYVNAVIRCDTSLSATDLLARLHDIENAFGRKRMQRWGSRTMDLDLLAFGQAVLPDLEGYSRWRNLADDLRSLRAPETLVVPHPRMAERAFVLIPMLDVAADWRHPVDGLSVAQMAAALPSHEKLSVVPVGA